MAVSNEVAEQSWTEVSRQIDSIACLPAERRTNSKNQEEEHQRSEVAGAKVRIVLQGEDHEHQHRAGDELGEELARLGHERLRVGAKDAGSGVLSGNSTNVGAALVKVNGGFVVAVNDSSASEGTGYLSASIRGPLAPRESPEDAVRKSDSRVEMPSCTASRIHSKHDADAPSEQDMSV